MANALDPAVRGKICINFSTHALVHKTREERNEYLKMIRLKIANVLDECRYSSNMMDGWYIELYDKEEDDEKD